ncbi:MAG: hypothetical protein IPM18_14915 [Phycisphaerales bacterium]|nr:hypothetical protein [Phycisphaerales bacterium]
MIELLLVVTLVFLLLSVLLPSVYAARARARQTECLANLRTLATASIAYSAEDRGASVLPAHPWADHNTRYDDGIYDFGGADGAVDAFGGRLAAGGIQASPTRPLNPFLSLTGGMGPGSRVFRCPLDTGFDPQVGYDWKIWDESLRRRSAFHTVGTSYWGNAVRAYGPRDISGQRHMYSFGVFLRSYSRIPSPAETVLYYEMPTIFNLMQLRDERDRLTFRSHGVAGWHTAGPRFWIVYCDGHAGPVDLPAGWLPGNNARAGNLRGRAVRFDCFPDPPILDAPLGIPAGVDSGGSLQGDQP